MDELTTPIEARPISAGVARPVQLVYASGPAPPANPMRLESVVRGAAGIWLLAIGLLILPLPLVLEIALYGTSSVPPPPALMALGKAIEAVAALIVALLLLRTHHLPAAALGLSLRHPLRQLALALPTLIGVYAVFLTTVLALAFSPLGPGLEEEVETRRDFLQMLPIHDMLMTTLLLVPVALHEELLFRALLIPVLRRLSGSWLVSVLVASAIFGALHVAQGAVGIVQIFAVGITFAVAFLLTRSLLAVVVAHYVFNFVQFQLARVMLPLLDAATQSAP